MNTDSPVPYGTVRTSGEAHTIHFELRLAHPLESAWAAVATPGGLRGWLAAADPFEPGPGGSVTLRWLNGGVTAPGRITAWQKRRLAEYTVDVHGVFGFALRSVDDGAGTRLSFSNDFTGDDPAALDQLAGWHHHLELLCEELEGRPADWSAWTPDRFAALRAAYAAGV